MRVQYIGDQVRGFYRVAQLGHLWEMTPKVAQERLKILTFFDKHGLAATVDAFGVSRRTLYRWKKALRESGGNPAALIPRSSVPKRKRTPTADPRLVAEIRRLRTTYPNLGKEKLSVLLAPWCEAHGIPLPSVSTLGRIIARAPDKMRLVPQRLDARGRPKPLKRSSKPRKPKGARTTALQCLAVDTIERVRDGLKRYLVTFGNAEKIHPWIFSARLVAAHVRDGLREST
ncbi:MAG: helix-turn-helix domain-containing protein, partial [Halothiobacillaceae bacterium]